MYLELLEDEAKAVYDRLPITGVLPPRKKRGKDNQIRVFIDMPTYRVLNKRYFLQGEVGDDPQKLIEQLAKSICEERVIF